MRLLCRKAEGDDTEILRIPAFQNIVIRLYKKQKEWKTLPVPEEKRKFRKNSFSHFPLISGP